MAITTTSAKGREFLEREEGVVLRAYRDVAGVWTIGAGLTAASGVVAPKAGMAITREEADRLLVRALRRNYEPAVLRAMPGASQREFDAGVSFHFNTGSIGKASWVNAWLVRQWPGVHAGLLKWVRGGGKVLPALASRREREFRLMREGLYAVLPTAPKVRPSAARIVVPLSAAEVQAARDGLRKLGYDPGADEALFSLEAVLRFQRDHDLTVDGVVGRATLSTLQRRLDARSKSGRTAAAGGAGAALTQAPGVGATLPDGVILSVIGIIVAASLLVQAWNYRDVLAAKIAPLAPKLAARLRSF